MIIGTCHFVTRRAAVQYYSDYDGDAAADSVASKLAAGEIHIGRPPLKPGEKLLLTDNGTRYAIEEVS